MVGRWHHLLCDHLQYSVFVDTSMLSTYFVGLHASNMSCYSAWKRISMFCMLIRCGVPKIRWRHPHMQLVASPGGGFVLES